MSTYIDGKMRRYNLLFAVNGGAFAIAKLLKGVGDSPVVLGGLQLWHLALGSIIFTALMVADIYLFGQTMKRQFLGELVFGVYGKLILFAIGMLIILGWALAASR